MGCAVVSDLDLWPHGNVHQTAQLLVICASVNVGSFPVESKALEKVKLLHEGKSLISSVLTGPGTSVAVFSEDHFEGDSYVVSSSSQVLQTSEQKFFHHWKSTSNDNVRSLVFHSRVLHHCPLLS